MQWSLGTGPRNVRAFRGGRRRIPASLWGMTTALDDRDHRILALLQADAWLSYTAPLLLMVICAALLYWRTSSDLFAAPANSSAAAGSLIKFANSLVQRGSDLVSRHVSIGVGGYLAMIACIVLALRGIRRFRNPPQHSSAIT